MYSGVPKICPCSVSDGSASFSSSASRLCTFAMPKSQTLTTSTSWPSSPTSSMTMTFSGFKSRWTTPPSWAAASALHTWATRRTVRASSSRPWARMMSPRSWPSTYSITM